MITYAILGDIDISLNVPQTFRDPPFAVDKDTGEVLLNTKFTPDLKGYFNFSVVARDKDGLQDISQVFVRNTFAYMFLVSMCFN